MKRILTLTDFSDIANHAVDTAMIFAKKNDAILEIYHVLKPSDHIYYELDSDPELFIRNKNNIIINTKLDGWKDRAVELGVQVHFIIGAVDLIQGVKDLVSSQNIDMIVMGSTGIDESDHAWGTTTQQVIKNVDIPVLVIKSEIKDYKLKNLVFASDLDVEDQSVLTRSLQLMKPASDAVIHLISVNTSSFFSQPRVVMKTALKDFEKLVEPYKSESAFFQDYSINAGIRHYIEEVKPDMLIMSNRDRHPIKKIFTPNAAINAVGEVECPVLILKG